VKIRRVEFRNFKLLDGVVVELSTDPSKPLTVIRAENGSGKTSLLWGLAWAFYGHDGLPSRTARLSSTERPTGVPTTVQVVVDFEHDPDGLGAHEYVLTRTVEETPKGGDEVSHGPTSTKLLIRTRSGEEPVPGEANAVLESFFPRRLREVFLTDGDRVQRFISGTVAARERQYNVHQAIRSLLGLDRLDEAEQDLVAVEKQFRKELAASGGHDVEAAQQRLEICENKLVAAKDKRDKANDNRTRIEEDIELLEKKLLEIKGHGDLDAINAELAKAIRMLAHAHEDEVALLESIRALFKSEESLSWALAEGPLRQGQKVLADLYDRRVIPGSSLGVLQDRLDMELCICGESLAPGTDHRLHVQGLLEEQATVSGERERLTEAFHRTRAGLNRFEGAREDEQDFWSQRPRLLQRQAEIADRQKEAQQRVKVLEERRDQIDEEEVRRHTISLASARKDQTECSEEIGSLDREITQLDEERSILAHRYESALKAAKSDARAQHRHEIAGDLRSLVSDTLGVLKNEHVKAVSDRMNTIFMEIVGSAPELAGAVFHGAHITDDFDIVVRAGNQRTLDTDYEVNGASQRALTLAFIWALMEVSGTVAPRVIDTPLGMTAGGVKRRMVEAITQPVRGDRPDYQAVLLLTRSEIRDIEPLLDERAGRFLTLSCSKDFPADLVHDWGASEPTILRCDCSHRQFCDVCERQYDADHDLRRRV
jgi:DNA sulfur modification protein DndD